MSRTASRSQPQPKRTQAPVAEIHGLDRFPIGRMYIIHHHLKRFEPCTAVSLAERLCVTPLTIKRDIAFMRDRMDMPIEWDSGEKSYYYTRDCDMLPVMSLTANEALAFAVMGRRFSRQGDSPFGRVVESMLKKIAPIFHGAVSVALDSVDSAVFTQTSGRGADEDELRFFFPLLEAVVGRSVLRLDYIKPDSSRTHRTGTGAPASCGGKKREMKGACGPERVIHPLHLAELGGEWTLIAHDPAERGIRHFVLRRIRDVVSSGATFEPPRNFDVRKHLRGCLGRFAGDKEYDVRLALTEHAAVYAREKPWHASQKLTALPDGRTELALCVNHLADVRSAVLRWGAEVEVLAPAELRAEVASSLEAALANYRA